MPYRNLSCEFSAARDGAPPRFRVVHGGRAVTGHIPARRTTPLWLAGNVAVLAHSRGGRPIPLPLPTTFCSATVLDDNGGGIPRPVRLSASRYSAAPAFPAILRYRSGLSAFVAADGAGRLILTVAGAPAATLSLDSEISGVLPRDISATLDDTMGRFRLALAADIAAGAPGDGASAALEFLRGGGFRCIAGRGEGDDFIWSFAQPGDPGSFAVAGVSAPGATATILFPFLPPGEAFDATWRDDSLDYYVKGELQIRPSTVTAGTKAVVKMKPSGGFLVELCLKR